MNKYYNQPTVIDGFRFSSLAESRRYAELKLLLRGKVITDLVLQPRFLLQEAFTDRFGNKYRKIEYVADFGYTEDDIPVVEDVKGMKTDVYLLKKKLFLKMFPRFKFIET